jgi:hypothetical protein
MVLIGMGGLIQFVALGVCVGAAAWRLAQHSGEAGSLSHHLLRSSVIATAIVVAVTMIAGAAGRLNAGDVLLLEICALAAAVGVTRGSADPRLPFDARALPTTVVALVSATLACACAFAIRHAPLTLYDSLSYHLHFAARWVQDARLSIVPTPFSDEAQAYAPGNGELVFAWLMLPFHSDVLARMGQLPFAIGGALAVYAIARQLGSEREHAVYPAAVFLMARPVIEQMVGANVDLVCAAGFLAAVYFTLVAVERDGPRDWAMVGIAAGLYAGTKYLALVYIPALLLLACARGIRRNALWALPGIAAFALPWYARNWIVAGSPIYPASLSIGGMTIARGAFTRAAMTNTIFHTSNVTLLPAMLAHAVGPTLFVVWLPCAIAGWIAMSRRGWWPAGALVAATLAMAPLYWFGFPVNVDSRFLMPAVGVAMVPMAFVFTAHRRWNTFVHAAYALSLAWIVVGLRRSIPAPLPWFMGDWLALNGLVPATMLPAFAVAAGAVAACWLVLRRRDALALPGLVMAIGCAATVLFAAGRSDSLDVTSPYIRQGYIASWDWISDNVRGATIAYTGINLPYPLTGERLTNRVVYVNIDGRSRWRFHDYDRGYRSGRFVPDPPLLAQPSGELQPMAQRSGPRDDAVRPRYERMHGDRDAWIFTLEQWRVQYLFVAMLSAYEIDYVWHNDRGFPIEDEWALADPVRFHIVYTNPQVHIYAFDPAVRAQG